MFVGLDGLGDSVLGQTRNYNELAVGIEDVEVDPFVWDAGADSGAEFGSADSPTVTPGYVTGLRNVGKFSDTPIGKLTMGMHVPPSDNRDRRVRTADAGSLPGALNVFWLNGDGLGEVDFDRYLVAWKSGDEEFQTDLDGDRVKVVMGRSKDRVIVEGLTNGTEYTVRVTHANAVGPAEVSSREATGTPAPRVRELVSSASQSPGIAKPDLFTVRSAAGFLFGLVQFTTGPEASTLGSVTFLPIKPLHVDGHPRNLVVELRLHEDDDGTAPALIGTFVPPPEYVEGPAKFVAPGEGFALSPSTNYWLKLALVQGEMYAYVTRHGEEDPTGQPGWSLLDDCFLSSLDIWPYGRSCTRERHLSHGPFLMSLNSPIESTLPRASITGGSAVEGEAIEFTVELSSAPGAEATLQYSTVDGSGDLPATASDGDYTPVSGGMITFAATETSKTISIATGDDSTDETNERFLVRLSNPSSNIVLSELDTAAGVILNNDQTTSSDSTLSGITLTDGDGNAITLNETFNRYRFEYTADAAASVDAITMSLSFDSDVNPHLLRYFDPIGKVAEGRKAQAGSVEFDRIGPGVNLLKALITSRDRSQQSLYQVNVTKPASSDATIATLVLEDNNSNDFVLSPAFSPSVTEYTATIPNNPPFYVDVGRNHGGADAEVSVDGTVVIPYSRSYPGDTFDMPAGENTLVIEVTAEDGTVKTYTFDVTVEISLEIKFGQGPYSVSEGSSVSIPVILNHAAPSALSIPLTAAKLGGASDADYSAPSSVEFMAGDTQQSVTFAANADLEADSGESIRLAFGSLPDGLTSIAPENATVNIQDVAPDTKTVNFGQSSYTVAEGGSVTIKLTLDSAADSNVDFPITSTNQGGATGDDYSSLPSIISIASGADEGSFTFMAVDDSTYDPGESVMLRLGALPAGYIAGTVNETTINIGNDDDAPLVTVSFDSDQYTAAEGGFASVSVILSDPPERAITVPITTRWLNGGADDDLTGPVRQQVVFGENETLQTFDVLIADDDVDDDDEKLVIGLGQSSDPRVEHGAPSTTTILITDDDDPELRVGFERTAYTIPEGDDENIRVVLDKDPERQIRITIAVTSGDADPADFEVEWPDDANPGELVFSESVMEQSFTFYSLEDDEEDNGETVTFSVDTQSADRVSLGSMSETTVTIKPRPSRTPGGGGSGGGSVGGSGGGGGGGGGSSNRPPSVDGPRNLQYPEHGAGPVAIYTAEDPEGTEITWQIEDTDAKHFRISEEGVLSFVNPPDYENPVDFRLNNTYSIRLLAVDSGIPRTSGRLQVNIEIKQVNEIGPITGETQLSVEENSTGILGQYLAEDPEEDAVSWSVSGPDADLFAIDEAGALSLKEPLDFESPASADGTNDYTINVVATDDNRRPVSRELPVTVKVTNVNEAPTGTPMHDVELTTRDAPYSLDLSGFFTDPDGDSLTYTVNVDAESDVASATLEGTALTIEPLGAGTTSFLLTATDDGEPPQSEQLQLTVTVIVVNEKPVATPLPALELTTKDILATLDLSEFFVDPDGDTLAYTLAEPTEPDVASATVEGNILSIASLKEGTTSFQLTATDIAGLTATIALKVSVAGPPPPPEPVPAPSPTPAPTQETALTSSPEPTVRPAPARLPTPTTVPSPTPTETPALSPAPTMTSTPTPTSTSAPTASPTPMAVSKPGPTPQDVRTVEPVAAPTSGKMSAGISAWVVALIVAGFLLVPIGAAFYVYRLRR